MASSFSCCSNVRMIMGSKGGNKCGLVVIVLMLVWVWIISMGCMASLSTNAHLQHYKMTMNMNMGVEELEGKGVKGCMSMPYMVVLGASMADVGENAIAMPSRSNAGFPPYGIDYFGKPVGRYSNGRLFVDFLSQELGYGLLHPYLKSVGANFTHGISFASSGSTIQNTTVTSNGSKSNGLFSFLVQIDQLRQFKDVILKIWQHAPALGERNEAYLPSMETLEEAVVLIEIGLNDYLGFKYDIDEENELDKVFVDSIVAILESGIRRVLELGMKKFVVMNLYPMGCMPIFKSDEAKRDMVGCIIKRNQLSNLHNEMVSKMLHEKLALEYPSSTFLIFDANSLFKHAIYNPSIYGVKYPLEPCCGYFKNVEQIMCGESGYIEEEKAYYVGKRCEDPSLYLSWDGVHPTETFARHMAYGIINGSFLLPPFTIQKTCTPISSG